MGNSVSKDYLLPLVKIESMSSLEIAELTGKRHDNVLRDIKSMLSELYVATSELSYEEIKGVSLTLDRQGRTGSISLDKRHTLVLVTGYSAKLRDTVIERWQFLEDQLEILKTKSGIKKHQLDAMEALSHLLPDDLQGEALSYIKANTVVNKTVSNLFGFKKMLKKDLMSDDMLSVRDKVLDDYIKLYEVVQDNGIVKQALYAKYQPRRLENANAHA